MLAILKDEDWLLTSNGEGYKDMIFYAMYRPISILESSEILD